MSEFFLKADILESYPYLSSVDGSFSIVDGCAFLEKK